MSKKNKLQGKSERREIRQGRPVWPVVPNGPALSEDFDIITNPKAKVSAPHRKSIMHERSRSVVMPEAVGPTRQEKAEATIQKLTMRQLARRKHQYFARANGARIRRQKLVENSRFAPALLRLEQINNTLLDIVIGEILRRITVKRLSSTPDNA